MKSRLSSKGQVTIPGAIRDYLGLVAGTEVHFIVRDGTVVVEKGGGETDPVDRVYGTLTLDRPVDDLIEEMRGPVSADPTRRRRR